MEFGNNNVVILNNLIERTFNALKDNKQDFLEPLKQIEKAFGENIDMHKNIFSRLKKDNNNDFDELLKNNTNNLAFYLEDIYIKIKKQQAIINNQNEILLSYEYQIKKHYDNLICDIKVLDYIKEDTKLKKDGFRVNALNALMCIYQIKMVLEANSKLKEQLENQFLIIYPLIKESFYRFLDYRKKQNIINANQNIKKSFKVYLENNNELSEFNDTLKQLKVSINKYEDNIKINAP